jgi:hypothetical protein
MFLNSRSGQPGRKYPPASVGDGRGPIWVGDCFIAIVVRQRGVSNLKTERSNAMKIDIEQLPAIDLEAGMRAVSSDASVVDAITVRIAIWIAEMI